MPRYKLTIEYAGTRYAGWQRQANARTIQGELHRAIGEGLGVSTFETYGSGRTDAGVHALAQVAHLDLARPAPPATVLERVNARLPADINILDVDRVPARFHARHSAVARSYLYQISRRRTAFAKPFVWWVREPLNLAHMDAARRQLAGFRDYRSFTDDDPSEKSTAVLINRIAMAEHGDLILIRVVGSHFLWKMVRRLVGVLVEVGRGGLAVEDMPRLFAASSDAPAKLTAPASGLFLERVFYDEPPDEWPLTPALS